MALIAGGVTAVYFIQNQPQDLGPILTNHKLPKTPPDWITYRQPEDGWQISYPKQWEHNAETPAQLPSIEETFFPTNYKQRDLYQKALPMIKISVESSGTLNAKFKMQDAATNTPGSYTFSPGDFDGNKAYISSHVASIKGGLFKTIRFETNGKFYEINVVTFEDGVPDQILKTFKPGPISETEFSNLNISDLRKKFDLRSQLPELLSECRNNNKQIYTTGGQEKITNENQEGTILYKTVVGQECDSFIPVPIAPSDYYTYYSDGKDWEASAILENKNDPECQIIGSDCIYKIRNGQVISQK